MSNMSRFFEGVFGGRGESAEEQAALAQERNAILDQGSKLWEVDLLEFAAQIGADESTAAKAMELIADASTPEQKQSRINALLAQIGAAIGENAARDILNAAGQKQERTRTAFIDILRGPAGKAVAIAALAALMLLGPLGQAKSVSAAPKAGEPTTVLPAGKDEDDEPIDAKNSALPQATAGKGTSPELNVSQGLTETKPLTSTESLSNTQSFTVTRFVSALEAVSGTHKLLRKGDRIDGLALTITDRDNRTGEPITVTVAVSIDGEVFKLRSDLTPEAARALFEPAITSTHSITELMTLLPPEWGRVAAITNVRKEPSTNAEVVGQLSPTDTKPTRFVELRDGWYKTATGGWVFGELVTEVDAPADTGGSEVDRKREAVVAALAQQTGLKPELFDLVPSVAGGEQEEDGTITALVGDRIIATIRISGNTYVITLGLTGLDLQELQKLNVGQSGANVVPEQVASGPVVVAESVVAPARPSATPTDEVQAASVATAIPAKPAREATPVIVESLRRENHPDKSLWTDVTLMVKNNSVALYLSDDYNVPDPDNGYWKAISGGGESPAFISGIEFQTVQGIKQSSSAEWMVNNPATVKSATELGLIEVDGDKNPIQEKESDFVPGEQFSKSVQTFFEMLRNAGKRSRGSVDHIDIIVHRVVSDYYGDSSKAEVVPENPVVVLSDGSIEVHISILRPGGWVIQTAILRALTIFLDEQGLSYTDIKDGGLPLASELLGGSYSFVGDLDGNTYIIPGLSLSIAD